MLVVIGVIAVLAGLAVPVSMRMVQKGRSTACLGNLRQLGMALNLYLGEHNQTMPVLAAGRSQKSEQVDVIDTKLKEYAPDGRIFSCPADTGNFAQTTGTSYHWNSALNGQSILNLNFMNNTTTTTIPILADKEGFHTYRENKVNILTADGRINQGLNFTTTP
jgi:type II secretory pathway pseudopilin PulG